MSSTYKPNKINLYNDQANATMLKMARYVPIVAIIYGLMVHFKVLPGSDLYSWQAFVVLVAGLLVTGLTQSSKPGQSAVQQLNFYLIFLSFSVFVRVNKV